MNVALALLVMLLAFSLVPASAQTAEAPARIVFLGDSVTDGHTYPLMVQQALRDAGQAVPVAINAGIGGDTAQGMNARLDRDVLAHHPTLVTLSAGGNDGVRQVTLAQYSGYITAIADRLRAEKIPLVILTTAIYGAKNAELERRTDEYNQWLRGFARERGLKLAEVNALFRAAREEKGTASVIEPDDIHPNWEGQRLIARAVLDALGHPDVAVPETLELSVMPGVIPLWRMRVATNAKPLDADAVKAVLRGQANQDKPFADWKEVSLPEMTPQNHPWYEQERRRGFALSLDKIVGAGKRFEGVAFLENPTDAPKPMFFNTGADLQSVWLNGERIYQNTEFRGWHAGRERIAATLQPGSNTVFIETGARFFLSVTDDNQW